MNVAQVQAHLARIDRSLRRAQIREGAGDVRVVRMPDGSEGRYVFNGVPPILEVEDHVRHALIDLWSLCDHVRSNLKAANVSPQPIWDLRDADRRFALAADLANVAKHGTLTKPPHGDFVPSFGIGRYCARIERDPRSGALLHAGIRRLVVSPHRIELDIINQDDPEAFRYELPVLDPTGAEVAEASEVMVHAYTRWGELLDVFGLPWPGDVGN